MCLDWPQQMTATGRNTTYKACRESLSPTDAVDSWTCNAQGYKVHLLRGQSLLARFIVWLWACVGTRGQGDMGMCDLDRVMHWKEIILRSNSPWGYHHIYT